MWYASPARPFRRAHSIRRSGPRQRANRAPAPVAVHGQRLAVERVGDEERQQLLRVLERAVRVRPARDQRVDAVGAYRSEHLEVAARLGGGVRARRAKWIVLDGGLALGDVPVHLVRRDVHEPDPRRRGMVEQHLRAGDVRLDELGRPENRAVDVRLGGEVDDRVAAGGRLRDRGRRRVADDELDPGLRRGSPGCRSRSACRARGHRRPRPGAFGEVGADEPGATGDEHAHARRLRDPRRRAPSISASPVPPWCMTTLWFQRKTGRATRGEEVHPGPRPVHVPLVGDRRLAAAKNRQRPVPASSPSASASIRKAARCS